MSAEVFREVVLVKREGDSFRFVPFSEYKGVKPLWAVNVAVLDEGRVHWGNHYFYFLPGLFWRESRWTYELTALRFDADWKGDKENPFSLPADQVRQLRPLVVAELNRRDPAAQMGNRLDGLLTDGLEASSYVCPQNALILLSWLSIPLAIVGLCSMFVRPKVAPVAALGPPQAEKGTS